MDIDSLPSFRVFYTEQEARSFLDSLTGLGISAFLVEDKLNIDGAFVGVAADSIYRIKIQQEDFSRAQQLLLEKAERIYTQIPEGHYLLDFSVEELQDILSKPLEWSVDDIVISKMILRSKGIDTDQTLHQKVSDVSTSQFHPKEWSTKELVMAYFCILLLGIGGIVIGLVMWQSKKTLPDGTMIFSNSEDDRLHGRVIFLIGVISVITGTVAAIAENTY